MAKTFREWNMDQRWRCDTLFHIISSLGVRPVLSSSIRLRGGPAVVRYVVD